MINLKPKICIIAIVLFSSMASAGLLDIAGSAASWFKSWLYEDASSVGQFTEAIMSNNPAKAEQLLSENQSKEEIINGATPSGMTMLELAVSRNRVAIVEKLLLAGANPNHPAPPREMGAFAQAIKVNSVEIAEILLRHGANLANENGIPYLHLAAIGGCAKIAQLLIVKGANPNQEFNGWTALHVAANSCHRSSALEVAKVLIDAGADMEALVHGDTPMALAATNYYRKMVSYLMERGAVQHIENASETQKFVFELAQRKNEESQRKAKAEKAREEKEKREALKAQFGKKEKKILPPPAKVTEIKNQGQALLEEIYDRPFLTNIPGKFLNLSAQKEAEQLVLLHFIRDAGNEQNLTMSLQFVVGTKSPQIHERILPLAAETFVDGRVHLFALHRNENGITERKTATYEGFDRYKKITKKGVTQRTKDSNICAFEGGIELSRLADGKMKIYAKTQFGNNNIPLKMVLVPTKEDFDLIAQKRLEMAHSKPVMSKPAVVETSKIRYPSALEIAGHYVGSLNNVRYEAWIPHFNRGNFEIVFRITDKTGKPSHKKLLAVASGPMGEELGFNLLTPLSEAGHLLKFVPGQTSFDGKTERQIKTRGLLRQLCFNEPLTILGKETGVIVLSARTTLHDTEKLELTRIDDMEAAPDLENERTQDLHDDIDNLDEDLPFEYDEEIPEASYSLEDNIGLTQKEKNASLTSKPAKARQKWNDNRDGFQPTKEDIKKHGVLGYSNQEKERFERARKRDSVILRDFAARKVETDEATKSVVPRIAKPREDYIEDYQALRTRLNPYTEYASCPLYDESNFENNIWFGQGFILESGRSYRQEKKRIVLNMKNFNGMEQFAPGASWCSFFNAEYGDKNREKGINAHCSYHENSFGDEQKSYLNISGHGTFEIRKPARGNEYLLYRIPQHDDKDGVRIVYVMRRWENMSKKTTVLEKAHEFIGFRSNYRTQLTAIADQENLFEKAHLVENLLINEIKYHAISYGRQHPLSLEIRFQADSQCELLEKIDNYKVKTWRQALYWHVDMINQNLAMISIPFENSFGHIEAITFKLRINGDNSIEFSQSFNLKDEQK